MLSRRWLLAAGLAPAPALIAGASAAAGATDANPSVVMLANRDELSRAKPDASVTGVILAGFYSPGDGGGAQYRRVTHEPPHPGKVRSADGAWWELAEDCPFPEMFGADGSYARDTPAFQDCCDYVRANFVYSGQGNADVGAVHLSARVYHIDQSIDFGSAGDGRATGLGWGIVGQGRFLSAIRLKLDAPYPGIDASGMAHFFLRDLLIEREPSDLSSCAVLLARVKGGNFHNDTNLMEDVVIGHGGRNSVAAVICQAGDTSSLNRVQLENWDATALSIGVSLPVVLSGPFQIGPTASTIQLGPAASSDPKAYVGRTMRIFGHASVGVALHTIVAYDGASKVATLDSPLPAPANPKWRFEIFAVSSKFRTLSNYPDATQYRLSGCNLSGRTACRFTGGAELTAINSYFAVIGPGEEAVFLVDDHQPYVSSCFRFFNTRWENQTRSPPSKNIFAFLTRTEVKVLVIHGEVNSDSLASNISQAAKIATRDGGSIHYVALYGASADADTPLFDIRDAHGAPGHIDCVEGFVPFNNLGVIGSVGVWRLENSTGYGDALTETLAQICHSGSYKGVQFVPRQARLSGAAGTVAQVLALQPFDAALSPTHGGRGPQLRARFAVPAKALDGATPKVMRRLKVEVRGHCAKDTRLSVAIGPGSQAASSGPLDSGRFHLDLLIMRRGSGLVWSGELWNGQAMLTVIDGALPAFDETAPLNIDLVELSAADNAINPATSLGLLM